MDGYVYVHPATGRETVRGVAAVQARFTHAHVALGLAARHERVAVRERGARIDASFDRDDVVLSTPTRIEGWQAISDRVF